MVVLGNMSWVNVNFRLNFGSEDLNIKGKRI